MKYALTLVVVADGGVARFFVLRSGERLKEHQHLRMEVPEADEERGPAPRVQDSFGRQHHKIERRLTAHEANEEEFLATVAAKIADLMTGLGADRLILCAAPRALGSLRTALARSTSHYDMSTLAKDVVKESVAQIQDRIDGLSGLPQSPPGEKYRAA